MPGFDFLSEELEQLAHPGGDEISEIELEDFDQPLGDDPHFAEAERPSQL